MSFSCSDSIHINIEVSIMVKKWVQMDENALLSVQGGSKDSYCTGQIAARVLVKKLRGLPITPNDFICR